MRNQELAGKRILIIEDDAMIQKMIVKALAEAAVELDSASDGLEAVTKLTQERRYDVILLDLVMPRMNGYAVINFLLNNQPDMLRKTIIVSSNPHSILQSIYGVVRKPFDTGQLLETVTNCVREAAESAHPAS